MFYLKYRPQTIEELDNSRVKDTISKILKSKHLPHAFLFVGHKGSGKTSTARIFAKAINCLKNKFGSLSTSIEPCNICSNCISIQSSSSVDIIEMDAASNRGIDEIKRLIQEAMFTPMNSSYRVFIIDEAHMITTEGFNALLKTLEEPPSSVVFILATTNLEKVPKTIVSRCMVVNFGSAKKQDILTMLKRIVKHERIHIDEALFDLITKHSENSFRDGAKILEELVLHNALTLEKGTQVLGVLGKESLLKMVQKQSLKDTLAWLEEFNEKSGNFKYLIEQLLAELHEALLYKNGLAKNTEVGVLFSVSEITQLMKLLNEAYNNLKFSPIESLPLEIALVEFYNRKSNI